MTGLWLLQCRKSTGCQSSIPRAELEEGIPQMVRFYNEIVEAITLTDLLLFAVGWEDIGSEFSSAMETRTRSANLWVAIYLGQIVMTSSDPYIAGEQQGASSSADWLREGWSASVRL